MPMQLFLHFKVTKNRFDGTLGKVYLDFDRETLSMSGKKREDFVAPKKENRSVRSVKPPRTATGTPVRKNTKHDKERTSTPAFAQESKPTFGANSKPIKGHSASAKDRNANSGSCGTSLTTVSRSSAANEGAKPTTAEQSKGLTSLSSKATRFNRFSSQKPVLTGNKISVKQLDVDNVYLQ